MASETTCFPPQLDSMLRHKAIRLARQKNTRLYAGCVCTLENTGYVSFWNDGFLHLDSCASLQSRQLKVCRGRGGQRSSWRAPPAPVFPLQNPEGGKKADFLAEKYTGVFLKAKRFQPQLSKTDPEIPLIMCSSVRSLNPVAGDSWPTYSSLVEEQRQPWCPRGTGTCGCPCCPMGTLPRPSALQEIFCLLCN